MKGCLCSAKLLHGCWRDGKVSVVSGTSWRRRDPNDLTHLWQGKTSRYRTLHWDQHGLGYTCQTSSMNAEPAASRRLISSATHCAMVANSPGNRHPSLITPALRAHLQWCSTPRSAAVLYTSVDCHSLSPTARMTRGGLPLESLHYQQKRFCLSPPRKVCSRARAAVRGKTYA